MMSTPLRAQEPWPWPFSLSELTAGLRRYLDDPTLAITQVQPAAMPDRLPSIGRVRAVEVEYSGAKGDSRQRLVVKEPQGTTRTGLAGAGRREIGVYRSLASELPLDVPTLVAASSSGDWLLMEEIELERTPTQWRAGDYQMAIEKLINLHDRFWGLEEDLTTFTWLGHPLRADFEVHVAVAAKAIQRIVHKGEPAPIASHPERMSVLATLTTMAERVVEPLIEQPATLLHGDYWPGNIMVDKKGHMVVLDWQLTGIGPGIIDLLVFVNKSIWWFDPLPLAADEVVALYRQAIMHRTGIKWRDSDWDVLWDHALMWRFLQEWVDLLAATPPSLLEAQAKMLDEVWLEPVSRAVSQRLGA
jgi:aminoglycoside phosphotransferase